MENKILLIMFIGLLVACNQKNNEHLERVYYNKELLYVNNNYYENGSLKSAMTCRKIDVDSFIGHGYINYYYPTGEIEAFANMDMGNKIGTEYRYFKSGDIQGVLFYSPVGNLLSVIKYDSLGNVIEEIKRDQRKPQVIEEDINVDSSKFTVYSMNIPNYGKNIYLSTSRQGTIDSIMRSEDQFDVFQVKKDTSRFEVFIEYFDTESGNKTSYDYTHFWLYNY